VWLSRLTGEASQAAQYLFGFKMKALELIAALKTANPEISTDFDVARLLGVTPARISQWRSGNRDLTPRQVASALKRVAALAKARALKNAIQPIIELYPLECALSKQEAGWEMFPTDKKKFPRQHALRTHLSECKGIYVFYNSEGESIYSGKTERQSLWKEANLAYNRVRASHTVYLVDHPTRGAAFEPAWQKPRHPKKRVIQLYDVAAYFSAYKVSPDLIHPLESMIIRAFCNDPEVSYFHAAIP
jgi:DNA-binding transcriptional regulator YdaS (Cro superfamily)